MKTSSILGITVGTIFITAVIIASFKRAEHRPEPISIPELAPQVLPSPSIGPSSHFDAGPIQGGAMKVQTKPELALPYQFARATNGYAFARYARKHPEWGGYYYSYKINSECRQYRTNRSLWWGAGSDPHLHPVETTSETLQKRQRALEALDLFCKEYLSNPEDNEYEQLLEGKALGDRLLSPSLASNNSSRDRQIEAMSSILQLGDPTIFNLQGSSLFRSDAEGNIFIGGEWKPAKESLLIHVATQLVGCDLGAACNSTSPVTQLECIVSYRCYDTAEEALRTYFTPERFGTVNAYRSQIKAAIQRRDIDFFVPP